MQIGLSEDAGCKSSRPVLCRSRQLHLQVDQQGRCVQSDTHSINSVVAFPFTFTLSLVWFWLYLIINDTWLPSGLFHLSGLYLLLWMPACGNPTAATWTTAWIASRRCSPCRLSMQGTVSFLSCRSELRPTPGSGTNVRWRTIWKRDGWTSQPQSPWPLTRRTATRMTKGAWITLACLWHLWTTSSRTCGCRHLLSPKGWSDLANSFGWRTCRATTPTTSSAQPAEQNSFLAKKWNFFGVCRFQETKGITQLYRKILFQISWSCKHHLTTSQIQERGASSLGDHELLPSWDWVAGWGCGDFVDCLPNRRGLPWFV